MALMERKNLTKSNIVEYVINNKSISKVDISKQLNLSMPTVLTNVNELLDKGILIENGVFESTGGRKAKAISINPDYRYSIGVNITANHFAIVLVDFAGNVKEQSRIRKKFSADVSYCCEAVELINQFIEDKSDADMILGIGIAFPGIINQREHVLEKSHALKLENYSLNLWSQFIPYPVHFENDANAAMLAENTLGYGDAIYLSLNYTLGGAISMGGQLYLGDHHKAGEFGHMILVPNGRTCYCGKKGCADAYCSARVLTNNDETMDSFLESVQKGDQESLEIWDEYLEYLAVLITNLRMAYDTDIILGGDAGWVLQKHWMKLSEKVLRYNLFDRDLSYLKKCTYQREAAAIGVAKHFLNKHIQQL